MVLKNYFKVILRGWWLILPTLLSALTVALILTYSQTPIYRTSATYVVSPSASLGTVSDVARGLDTLTKRDSIMATYATIATSRRIRNEICEELNLTKAQEENLNITSEQVHPTNIIEITVESDDPELAKTIAVLVGEKTVDYVNNLYELYDIKLLDPPYTPYAPSKPDLVQNLVLAIVLGLLIGIALAFLAEYLRTPPVVNTDIIIDGETGAYNRQYLMQRLEQELSRIKRNPRALSLALMHLEQLDTVRELRQPAARSEALRQVALILTQQLRPEDLVAHLQGDRFALLLPDTSASSALRILEGVQARLQWNTFELPQRGIKLSFTTSFGVATCTDGISSQELLAQATEALKQARDKGHGEICLLDERG